MKVKAKIMCYYNNKRWKTGEVFSLDKPEHFSTRAMIQLSDSEFVEAVKQEQPKKLKIKAHELNVI